MHVLQAHLVLYDQSKLAWLQQKWYDNFMLKKSSRTQYRNLFLNVRWVLIVVHVVDKLLLELSAP